MKCHFLYALTSLKKWRRWRACKNSLLRNYLAMELKSLDINLYDMAIDILKKRRGLGTGALRRNNPYQRKNLKKSLQSMLDIETVLTPAIEKQMNTSEFHVMFISGVGEVFPYIRST